MNSPRPEVSIPDYQLIEPIASGSYGEVWRARNVTGALRAVKIVRRNTFQEDTHYEREFRGLKFYEPVSRSHPGVVNILHLGRNDSAGYFYYVMELADDANRSAATQRDSSASRDGNPAPPIPTEKYIPRTLRQELITRGRLPFHECLSICQTLASALEHLHKHNLVHRDIKPSNIIFVNGIAKLADIGLVIETCEAKSFVGTVGYIPPEGAGTPRADIYSLGIVLFVMATGKREEDFPVPPIGFPAGGEHRRALELQAITFRAAAANPSARYPNATQMRKELELLQRGESVRRRQARDWWLGHCRRQALTMVTVTALAAAVVALARRSEPPPPMRWSQNREANDAFNTGLLLFRQNTDGAFARSIHHFQQAIALDPAFARAYARLSLACFWTNVIDPQNLARAYALAEKALALDPKCDEAHFALSSFSGHTFDHETAENHARLAISLNPYSDEYYYGYAAFLSVLGRTNEALHQLEMGQRLDGRSSFLGLQFAAFVFEAARRYKDVIRVVHDHIEQDPASRARQTERFLVPAYRELGDYVKAIECERDVALSRGGDSRQALLRYDMLKSALERHGHSGYWHQLLEWNLAQHTNPVLIASLYARVAATEQALTALEAALQQSPITLRFEINRNPAFDPLRNLPRFRALLQRLNMPVRSDDTAR